MATADITASRLREILDYSIVTGYFSWREKISSKVVIGNRAGRPAGARGVVTIKINKRRYLAHRLAWLFITGAWPEYEIDHIDTRPSNNAWHNLRDVTGMVNSQNLRKAKPNSRTGRLGVFRRNRPRPYYAQIMTDGVLRHLGSFLTEDEAAHAYLTAKRVLHAGCTI